jgi:hypothetical protein
VKLNAEQFGVLQVALVLLILFAAATLFAQMRRP